MSCSFQPNKAVNYATDFSQQTCSSLQTNTVDPKQGTALQNTTSPTKAFSHTLSCHDGGRPGMW